MNTTFPQCIQTFKKIPSANKLYYVINSWIMDSKAKNK